MRSSPPAALAPWNRVTERPGRGSEAELSRALRCFSSRPPASHAPRLPTLLQEMRGRHARHDFAGALELAEAILAQSPGHADARQCADACRGKLIDRYAGLLGSLDRVPVRLLPLAQVDARCIDHRAAFVLAQVDGVSSLEVILDVSGMSRVEALRILHDLAHRRIIALRCRTLRPAASVVESGVRERVKKEKG